MKISFAVKGAREAYRLVWVLDARAEDMVMEHVCGNELQLECMSVI